MTAGALLSVEGNFKPIEHSHFKLQFLHSPCKRKRRGMIRSFVAFPPCNIRLRERVPHFKEPELSVARNMQAHPPVSIDRNQCETLLPAFIAVVRVPPPTTDLGPIGTLSSTTGRGTGVPVPLHRDGHTVAARSFPSPPAPPLSVVFCLSLIPPFSD